MSSESKDDTRKLASESNEDENYMKTDMEHQLSTEIKETESLETVKSPDVKATIKDNLTTLSLKEEISWEKKPKIVNKCVGDNVGTSSGNTALGNKIQAAVSSSTTSFQISCHQPITTQSANMVQKPTDYYTRLRSTFGSVLGEDAMNQRMKSLDSGQNLHGSIPAQSIIWPLQNYKMFPEGISHSTKTTEVRRDDCLYQTTRHPSIYHTVSPNQTDSPPMYINNAEMPRAGDCVFQTLQLSDSNNKGLIQSTPSAFRRNTRVQSIDQRPVIPLSTQAHQTNRPLPMNLYPQIPKPCTSFTIDSILNDDKKEKIGTTMDINQRPMSNSAFTPVGPHFAGVIPEAITQQKRQGIVHHYYNDLGCTPLLSKQGNILWFPIRPFPPTLIQHVPHPMIYPSHHFPGSIASPESHTELDNSQLFKEERMHNLLINSRNTTSMEENGIHSPINMLTGMSEKFLGRNQDGEAVFGMELCPETFMSIPLLEKDPQKQKARKSRVKTLNDQRGQSEKKVLKNTKREKKKTKKETEIKVLTSRKPVKEARRFKCEECSKCYTRAFSLKTHMRCHSGERPFQCSICSKAFTQSGTLDCHMRTHSGEKPYVCQICRKGFTHASALRTHTRTHTGERPYPCLFPGCGRRFGDSSTLTKHSRVHTGIRPFKCPHCPLCFAQSGNMYKHVKSIHLKDK